MKFAILRFNPEPIIIDHRSLKVAVAEQVTSPFDAL